MAVSELCCRLLCESQGMTVDEFKFIYFWEWGHRMWGRALGEPGVMRHQGRALLLP